MTDELDLLRAWRPAEPADAAAPPPSAAMAAARARLDAHIAASAGHRPPPAPRARRWWLLAAPGALATAGAAALVLALGSGVEDGTVLPAGAAAQALNRAADVAERSTAAAPFPDATQFFYVKSQETRLEIADLGNGRVAPTLRTSTTEAWQSATHPGRRRVSAQEPRWPSAQARRGWIAAGRPALATPARPLAPLRRTVFHLGNERLTYSEIRDFDQSADATYRRLRAHYVSGQGGTIDDELFVQVGDALRQQAAPPKLRAALYRVLAMIPGVQYLGRVRDRLGRPALGVARTDTAAGATIRRELLFDPRSSELLAEQEVMFAAPRALRGLIRPGTITGDAVYVRRASVDRAGRRP